MSETKRMDISNVSTPHKQKKSPKKQRTYRIDVTLGESTFETCPEFSFVDFIKKYGSQPTLGESFDDAREVAAIAQRFEAKYGPKELQSGKKARTQEMDDYYDPGDGYDEDDPFIDNTEAYDEVIPSSMTTQYGGFYINQGMLDFKNLHEDPSDIRKAKNKKRLKILESDPEDETGPALAKKFNSLKHKKKLEGKLLETKMRVTGDKEGEQLVRKKQKLKFTRIKSAADPMSQKDKTNSSVILPPAASTVVAVITNVAVTTASRIITTTVAAPGRSITTTVTGGDIGTGSEILRDDQLRSIEDIFNSVLNENLNEDSCSKSGEEGKGENQLAEKNTQLPALLPPNLLEAIENMKREAKESKEKKFFSTYINKLLLDIELGSHKLPWGSKTAIYSHLSEHLPCGKNTLQRRAKKLRASQEEDQVKGPIRTLKEAILKVMPGLQEQHEMDVQKAKIQAEVKEEVADMVKEEISTESEGEEKSDAKKKPKGPRRKFIWNSEIRTLLVGIIATKVGHYSTFKSRSQTVEEYLKAYLDSEIKPLWPAGWMQTSTLFKESRKAHEEVTKGGQQQGKQKKAITSSETTPIISEMNHSHMQKKAAVDLAATNIENIQPQVIKTEHAIEVSGVLDSGSKSKGTVVINLPNSMGSLPQSFHSSTPGSSISSTGNLSNHAAKGNVALPQVVQISASPAATFVTQKPCLTLASSSVKEVASASLPETSKSATVNEVQSMNPAFSHASSDPKMAAQLASISSITSSHSEGLGDLNNNGSTKLSLPPPPPPPVQQQGRHIYKQLNSQRPKISTLVNKSIPKQTTNIHQPTQSSGEPTTAESMQQKADSRLSPHEAVKNSNSSWTAVASVVPSSQSVNPVSVNLANISTPNAGVASVPENQILVPQMHQQKMMRVSSKLNLNVINKQNLLGNGSSTSSTARTLTGSETLNKHSVASIKTIGPAFQEDLLNSKLVQYRDDQKKSAELNQQLKSGVVVTTSSSLQMLNPNNQHVKTGIVIGTGALPLFKPHKAADFAGWISSRSKSIKQPIPLRTTTLSAQTTASTTRSSPTTALSNKSSLFNNSLSLPMSRTSTATPQISPMFPAEVTALSLYEKIRTQVQHQEAIEGQALKNLAMALKLGGKSETDIFGAKSGTMKDVGRTSQLCSKISGIDGRAVACLDDSQPTSLGSCNPGAKVDNMQGTNFKELGGSISQMSSADLISSRCHQKAFQKYEQFAAATSNTNQIKNSLVLENKKMAHNLPYSERCLLFKDKFPADKLHDGDKLLQTASSEAGTTKNSLSSALKRHVSRPSNSSCQLSDSGSFVTSSKLTDSTLKLPPACQMQVKPSNLLSNTKRHIKNESLIRSKKKYIQSSTVSSAYGHRNIFSQIGKSISGQHLSAQTAKDCFSNNSCPENGDTSTSRSGKSLPDKLLPISQTSNSAILHTSLSQPNFGSVEMEHINERGLSKSFSPGSFQDAFSRYATHLLKGFVPILNSSIKASHPQTSKVITSCNEGVLESVKSSETTQPERSLGQDSNAKSSQET